MDLQEQLHMQLKQFNQKVANQNNLNDVDGGINSDPSGGISAFRPGASMNDTQEAVGVPPEKFVVGGETASEVNKSDKAEELQGMYDRIMGTSTASGANRDGQTGLSDYQMDA